MAKAIDVADAIIMLCNSKRYNCGGYRSKYKYSISNLYLQKLMYFLNVLHMLLSTKKKYNDPLIDDNTDNQFEKWDYGPVIYKVYEEYSQFSGNHITHVVPHLIGIQLTNNGSELEGIYHNYNDKRLSNGDKDFIDEYIYKFLKYNPFELVSKSHQEDQWKNRTFRGQYYDNKSSYLYYLKPENRKWFLKKLPK